MKKYLCLIVLCSCFSKSLQVTQRTGRITHIRVLGRASGEDKKEITWLLDDKTTRYEIVDEDDQHKVGDVDIFKIER